MADSVSVVKDYDAAWNAHDVEGVLAFFTDDAEVRMEPAPPDDEFGGAYSGLVVRRDLYDRRPSA
jgi:ketosteroid isomerase-like protein